MPGEGEQRRCAEGWRQSCDERLHFVRWGCLLRGVSEHIGAFAPPPACGGARLVQGAIAQHSNEPPAVFAASHVTALRLDRRKQGGLQKIPGLVGQS